jgi:hypothetical protein
MAGVASNDVDEAWKAFKLHLTSSKMANKKGGASMVARKFIADRKSGQNSTASAGTMRKNINLKDAALLNNTQQGLQRDQSNTWTRRISLRTTGAGTGLASHLAKRFGSSAVNDDCKSVVSMPATTRSTSPMREGRRFSLMGIRGTPRENNRSLVTPPRRTRSLTVNQHQKSALHAAAAPPPPQRNLRRAFSEWDVGDKKKPEAKPTKPPPQPVTAQSRSKSLDVSDFDNDFNFDSDGEPMLIRSFEATGIKVFADNTGELLESWGSRDELLEDFVPRKNRRASMHASPPRVRKNRGPARRSSMDDKLRPSLVNNRVPVVLSFKNKRGSVASSVTSEATLSDFFSRQESNDSATENGSRSVVDELFPKREVEEHYFDDSYIKGLEFLAPSRETQIRRIISRTEEDASDDVSALKTDL